MVSIDYGWDLPLGRLLGSSTNPVGRFLNGWRINGITSMRSLPAEHHFRLRITSAAGQSLGQRPITSAAISGDGTDDYRTSNLHNYVIARLRPTRRGKYGNLRRYVLTGPK